MATDSPKPAARKTVPVDGPSPDFASVPVLDLPKPAKVLSRDELNANRILHVPADADGNLQLSSRMGFAVNKITLRNVQTQQERHVYVPPNMEPSNWPLHRVATPQGERAVEVLANVEQEQYEGVQAEWTVNHLLATQTNPYTGRNYGYGALADPLARGEQNAAAWGFTGQMPRAPMAVG